MPALARITLAALAAAVLLGSLLGGAASANRISLSNRNIRAVWRELTFEAKETEIIPAGPIRCAVTMEGSFHAEQIIKVVGNLIGHITRAIVGHPCGAAEGQEYYFHNGTEAVLGEPPTSLPWHIRYAGFTGTLPVMTSVIVEITGMRMTVNYGLNRCLEIYGSATETRKWVFRVEAAGGVTSLEPITNPRHLIVQQGTSILCPELGRLSGVSGPVTLLGTTTQIRMRLI
jgi:hypothetical protein